MLYSVPKCGDWSDLGERMRHKQGCAIIFEELLSEVTLALLLSNSFGWIQALHVDADSSLLPSYTGSILSHLPALEN